MHSTGHFCGDEWRSRPCRRRNRRARSTRRATGLAPVKINCVVQRGVNESEVLPLVEHTAARSGYLPRFIEYMDVGTCNRWQMRRGGALARTARTYPTALSAGAFAVGLPRRGGRALSLSSTAAGEVGFISSVSQPFCGDCTRARLSADGQLYTCLFGRSGRDLRTLLRGGASDTALREAVTAVWRARVDRYSEERQPSEQARDGRVEMYRIGG
jgi:cyclic pyranopterin phosphate synthase